MRRVLLPTVFYLVTLLHITSVDGGSFEEENYGVKYASDCEGEFEIEISG